MSLLWCALYNLLRDMVIYLPEQTYAAARVNQELAKEGVPLPFGNRFWASNWPTRNAPFPGLIIHLIPSVNHYVSLGRKRLTYPVQVIVIVAPPPQVAYPFILDVAGYPEQIINLFIVLVRRALLIPASLPH